MAEQKDALVVHAVGRDASTLEARRKALSQAGFDVRTHEGLADLIQTLTTGVRPGCVLAEIDELPLSGAEFIERLRELECSLPVVITRETMSVPAAMRAVKAGAVDVIVEPYGTEDLAAAIESAFGLAALQLNGPTAPAHVAAKLERLTDRERAVLDDLVKGLNTKEIARDLGISPRTVEIHRGRVMLKLEARGIAHLFRMIFDNGRA